MNWLTILGLPLTPGSIQQATLDRLSDRRSTIVVQSGTFSVSGNDYHCARVGFDLLIKHGFQFTSELPKVDSYRHVLSTNLWAGPKGRRDPEHVKVDLASLLYDLRNRYGSDLLYITQGSPRYGDMLSEHLLKLGANLIDTPSSVELAYAAVGSDLPLHHARRDDPPKEGHANVFIGIGPLYHKSLSLDEHLKKARRISLVQLGYGTVVKQVKEINLRDPAMNYMTLVLEL